MELLIRIWVRLGKCFFVVLLQPQGGSLSWAVFTSGALLSPTQLFAL